MIVLNCYFFDNCSWAALLIFVHIRPNGRITWTIFSQQHRRFFHGQSSVGKHSTKARLYCRRQGRASTPAWYLPWLMTLHVTLCQRRMAPLVDAVVNSQTLLRCLMVAMMTMHLCCGYQMPGGCFVSYFNTAVNCWFTAKWPLFS